ncbi:MAG: hypothetical protein ACHQHN_13955 [Sphingobacteriales bacterium]
MDMNEKNENYLQNQVKFLGFGESLNQEISEKISKQEPEFVIEHRSVYGEDEATATLNFTRSKESDLYFFNSYDMAVKRGGENDTVKQTFYVGRENNTTAKEAYNLLSGRAVYKELSKMRMIREGGEQRLEPTGEKYMAWKELNFKQTDAKGNFETRLFFDNYGYDVEKVLKPFKFKELADEYDKSRVIESLKKGNLHRVTADDNGSEQKFLIAANPKDHTINIYDGNMQRVELKQVREIHHLAEKVKGEKHAANENKKQSRKLPEESAAKPAEKPRHYRKVS